MHCIKVYVPMNPCPCGYYPDLNRCHCAAPEIHRYINRISQAMLDRIDLMVEAVEISCREMLHPDQNESSDTIRARVTRMHELQKERFQGKHYQFNSQIPNEDLNRFCPLDQESEAFVASVYDSYHLSARTYCKLLKTARTIADMDGSADIHRQHLEEALYFRSPDKKFWGRV